MKVLVTGASGFIGSKLVPRLVQAGYKVRTFGRTELTRFNNLSSAVEHVKGDITDPQAVATAIEGCDVACHLAGLVSYRKADRDVQYAINVMGTRYLMQAALYGGVKRVIHTSSIAGMGIPPEGEIGNEEIKYNLEGLGLNYCDSKYQAELEVLDYAKKGLFALMLSPGIIFGEGDTHPHHHAIFTAISKGWLVGCPEGGVTFSDINDVVEAHVNAITLGRSGERYVIGSSNLTYLEAAHIVSKVIGSRPPKFTLPGRYIETAGNLCEAVFGFLGKPSPLTRQVAWLSQRKIFYSSSKAIAELKLQQTPFERTIERTASYYLGKKTS